MFSLHNEKSHVPNSVVFSCPTFYCVLTYINDDVQRDRPIRVE